MSYLNNQTTKEAKMKETLEKFGIKDFMSFIKTNYRNEYDDFVNNDHGSMSPPTLPDLSSIQNEDSQYNLVLLDSQPQPINTIINNENCSNVLEVINIFLSPPPVYLAFSANDLISLSSVLTLYNRADYHGFYSQMVKLIAAMRYSEIVDNSANTVAVRSSTGVTENKHKKLVCLGRRGWDVIDIMGFRGFGVLAIFTCSQITKMKYDTWNQFLEELSSESVPVVVFSLKTCSYHKSWENHIRSLQWPRGTLTMF